ncbi:hypothetical protein N665_3074s0001 [Sinapis alba]|nr:hypothetical protein N665_3074s0001 [Sinapis alba]
MVLILTVLFVSYIDYVGTKDAISHWEETEHCYKLELETHHVWDYAGENYFHRLIQFKSLMKFMNVVRGEFQIVSGINYRLVVEANDGSNNVGTMYEAVVLDQPWMKTMNLTSFTPLLKKRFL